MGIQLGSTIVNNIFGTKNISTTAVQTTVSGSVIGILSGSYSNGALWPSTTGSDIIVVNSPLISGSFGRWQFDGTSDYLNITQSTLNATFNTASVNQQFTFLFYGTIGSVSTRRALYAAGGADLGYENGGDAIVRTDTSPGSGKMHLDLRGRSGNYNRFTITADSGSLLNLAIVQTNNNSQSVYQDGVIVATSGALFDGYAPWLSSDGVSGANIGYNNDTDADNYNGQLGGAFLYNVALSASAISESAQAFYASVTGSSTTAVVSSSAVYLGSNLIYPTIPTTTTTTSTTTTTTTTTSTTTTTLAPLLFDTYGGGRVGYSLRKLSSTYTGSAVRVRRSNDNSEQDIGFVGQNFDSASLSTFVGANSAFVTKWYDQTDNNRTAAQTTAANQPRIVNAGTIETENGKTAINFGTNSNNWWLDLPNAALSASNLCSYFQVARINTFGSSNAGVFAPSTTNSTGIEVLQHDVISTPSYLRLNNTAKNNAANPLWTNNAQGMFTFITNASSTAAWNNTGSVSLTSTTAMGTLNFTGVYAIGRYAGGSSNVMSGEWQELVIYQADQTSNRTGIQGNINTYYAIY
jgi:hypothetical protein